MLLVIVRYSDKVDGADVARLCLKLPILVADFLGMDKTQPELDESEVEVWVMPHDVRDVNPKDIGITILADDYPERREALNGVSRSIAAVLLEYGQLHHGLTVNIRVRLAPADFYAFTT